MADRARATLLFLVQVVTDVELLAPIVREARRRGIATRVLVIEKARRRTPEIDRVLAAALDDVERVDEDEVVAGRTPLDDVGAVVTATESTAPAHAVAHALARRANELGVLTCTLQHGFENVGLTYFDADFPPGSVRFASHTIYTWGAEERLHREVPDETRWRCVAVGCSKAASAPSPLPARPGDNAKLVAVFENLHWTRYSERYREAFLGDLEATARAHPDTTFCVRPHPAGKWLTERFEGRRPRAANLLIAAPGERRWREHDAPALIELADAVITSPSTIALDAARRGRPVALVTNDLELPAYAPLTNLRSAQDWDGFVAGAAGADSARRGALAQLSADFVARVLVPGDAASRIVDRVVADLAAASGGPDRGRGP